MVTIHELLPGVLNAQIADISPVSSFFVLLELEIAAHNSQSQCSGQQPYVYVSYEILISFTLLSYLALTSDLVY